MTIEQAIGKVLRAKRTEMGSKLTNVAKRAGISLGHLSCMELGSSTASVVTLWNVCRSMGTTLSRVLREAEALVELDVDVVSWERELEV